MDIKNIQKNEVSKIESTNNLQKANIQQQKEKNQKIESKSKIQDKLQISSEAKNLQYIQKKIETAFYNSSKVMKQTAQQIYNRNFKA